MILIETCVPSPQSINIFRPLKFIKSADKFLKGIGIPPPQPNKHKSTIVTPLSFTSIFINLLYYFIFIHMILILPYII